MDRLDRAIEKTREYGRKFGVEYSKRDIKERLISNIIFSEIDIDKELAKLRITNYELRIKNKYEKIKKAKELAKLIGRYFSDIEMIGITGSVAACFPKVEDDIDIMIVTKKDSLWLNRLLLRLFILINRIPHRGYNKKEKGNEFCFNLWLEEDGLTLPKDRQTLQNAMDSILMIPILNRNNTYEKFLNANSWIGKYLINNYNPSALRAPPLDRGGRTFFRILNYLFFWPQYWYMKKRIGEGLVDRKRAFFHPNGTK